MSKGDPRTPGFARIGLVARIRVNPKDCIAVAELVEKVGAWREGMSFSQAVSIALSSLLESARMVDVLPRSDGFDFAEKVQQRFYLGEQNRQQVRARKVLLTRNMQLSQTPETIAPTMQEVHMRGAPPHLRPGQAARWLELEWKMQNDFANMSAADQAEFDTLTGDVPLD